jgi:DNA-binding transcriptional ArsR family regulator
MPIVHDDLPARVAPRVAVRPSLAVELEWALASGENEQYRRDHPLIAGVYDAHPDLQDRVRGMWARDEVMSCGGFMELMFLAHHGGLLFGTGADALIARLDELCRTIPTDDLPMISETAEDRAVVLRRLARLRRSAELRRRYVALVADMWAAIGDVWQEHGRPAVDAAIGGFSAQLAAGSDWRAVARSTSCDFGDLLDRTVAGLGPEGEFVIVPAFFTHKGLLVDLPGTVVLGVRTDTTAAEARARTEALARRLKAISDPTRLAILDALRSGPRTVTELAAAFGLAQPTVSNHVKVLRDAELVRDERDGTRRRLVVERAAADDLVAALRGVLAEPAGVGH